MDIEGAVALVFGAGSVSSGVSNGMATCMTYARARGRVVAADVDEAALTVTMEALRSEGRDCTGVLCDVTDEDAIRRAVDHATRTFGRIDILHNNVGILRLGGPEALAPEDWTLSQRTNVDSVYLTCRHVLPVMKAQNRGAIVNVSSIAGTRWCGQAMIAYSASKAAVEQITRTVAVEGAPFGIRCNAVAPGLIDTPMVEAPYASQAGGTEHMRAARAALCPSGRTGTPWEVADAALFLASDQAAYISGAILPVDGALSVRCF